MNVDDLGDRLLSDIPYAEKRRLISEQVPLIKTLSADESAALVDRLYRRSVELRENEQPEKAFELGRLITRIGAAGRVSTHVALGNMVCGDALNRLSQFKRAWPYFERSQWRFTHIGDEFGWARTVIGRLWCCAHVGTSQRVLAEFSKAKHIFKTHKDYRRMVTLYLNAGLLYKDCTQFTTALKCLKMALTIARRTAEVNQSNIPLILHAIATVYTQQDDNRRAIYYNRRLYRHFRKSGHPLQVLVLQNIAFLEKQQGKYRAALKRLNHILRLTTTNFPRVRHIAYRAQIECYLDTNNFPRACNLARQFLELSDIPDNERAAGTIYLARALAELHEFELSQDALNLGQAIYEQLGLPGELGRVHLWRGQIALRQGDYNSAVIEAGAALQLFRQERYYIQESSALLLTASALWAQGTDPVLVQNHVQVALELAGKSNSPPHIFNAYVLLGHLKRAQGMRTEAEYNYLSAIRVIEELQHDLTMLLRPTFLGDKGEATRALIDLYFEQGQVTRAFETLERSKAQVFFECLTDADALHWTRDDASRAIQSELNQLRADYQSCLGKVQEHMLGSSGFTEACREAARLKDLILSRTHELYNSPAIVDRKVLYEPASVNDIQARLPPEDVLIAYYDDGHIIHAFVISSQAIHHCSLADSKLVSQHLNRLAQQAGMAINALGSVRADPDAAPLAVLSDPALNNTRLKSAFNRSATALYDALIKPIAGQLVGIQRLVIVPYSQLHLLPFHLLYQAPANPDITGRYLIEDYEVVLLPTASLILHDSPKGAPGATILYDDWKGALRYSGRDAQRIHELIGGPPPYEAKLIDVEHLLQAPPHQVLHVIAHGKFDHDNPELSYVQLADRQLMINDLLQYDLRYGLVTLTACEVGQLKLSTMSGRVAAGDDLLGLGRAFLYAGAGTVVVSLWLIGDGLTLPLVEHFYTALQEGATKAAAIREAQLNLLAYLPNLHPVFWGVFQLIGDAGPLFADKRSAVSNLSHIT